MARRVVLLLAALALLLAACGGDDDSKDASRTTTTTAGTASSTNPASSAPVRYATPHALANIVIQIDNQLRPLANASDPCIHGPRVDCVGRTVDAYKTLDDLANAVDLLRQSVTKGYGFYAGELPNELVSLYDATLDAGATAKDASKAAQAACLPEPTDTCDAANAKLYDSLIDLYKQFNAWRKLL